MKIHQLPMGATFEYEGEEYVKTGPMLATGPGGQRLIPRYALLKVAGATAASAAPEAGPATVERQKVAAAFDAFCIACKPLIPKEDRATFEEAQRAFARAIG